MISFSRHFINNTGFKIGVTHWDGCFLRAPLHCVGVEEDISAAPLAVLVDDQSDLTGLQLGDWPAGWERGGETDRSEKNQSTGEGKKMYYLIKDRSKL